MTNFDKWKQELDLDDVSEMFRADGWGCQVCPAGEAGYCRNPRKNHLQLDCEKFFRQWAESEIEE